MTKDKGKKKHFKLNRWRRCSSVIAFVFQREYGCAAPWYAYYLRFP
jgi:hypothetical protein